MPLPNPLLQPMDAKAIANQSSRCSRALKKVRAAMLNPHEIKIPPRFTLQQIADLTGRSRDTITLWAQRGTLPAGDTTNPSRRSFSLPEALEYVREAARLDKRLRPEGAGAMVMTIAIFKGGVSKTLSTLALAQGLSLRGHRVLVIDTDPQGSLTTMFGFLPDVDVEVEHTILPLLRGDETSIEYAIRKTYWAGVDLVPACSALFEAELHLPMKQAKDRSFQFWKVLTEGLHQARKDYDIILMDTQPALGYVVVNSLWASDGVLIPMTLEQLTYASSVQFWKLLAEFAVGLAHAGDRKVFEFINIYMSRVKDSREASNTVRSWINDTYGGRVIPVDIPESQVMQNASAEFKSVHDIERYTGNNKTYLRVREAYDRLAIDIEQCVLATWEKRVNAVAIGRANGDEDEPVAEAAA